MVPQRIFFFNIKLKFIINRSLSVILKLLFIVFNHLQFWLLELLDLVSELLDYLIFCLLVPFWIFLLHIKLELCISYLFLFISKIILQYLLQFCIILMNHVIVNICKAFQIFLFFLFELLFQLFFPYELFGCCLPLLKHIFVVLFFILKLVLLFIFRQLVFKIEFFDLSLL